MGVSGGWKAFFPKTYHLANLRRNLILSYCEKLLRTHHPFIIYIKCLPTPIQFLQEKSFMLNKKTYYVGLINKRAAGEIVKLLFQRNVKSDLTEMWSPIIVCVCYFFLFVLILSYIFFYFLSLNTLNKHNHVGPKFHLQKKEPYHTHVLDCQFHTLIVWSSEELKIHGYS